MRVSYELDLLNFEAWSGAVDTLNTLTCSQIRMLESYLEDIFEDGVDEVAINDFLWFETDTIADCLGYRSWEELEKDNMED